MSSIEELRKRLYKKDAAFQERKKIHRFSYRGDTGMPPSSWRQTHVAERPKRKGGMRRWIIAFFVLAVIGLASAAALYLFGYFDVGTISNRNIDIQITAPAEIGGGERVSWQVAVTNKNDVALNTADLIVSYPEGAQPVRTSRSERERRPLGTLGVGETKTEIFEAFVFGEAQSEKELHVSFEYRPEGSNAIFAKELSAPIRIARSPVGLTVRVPSEISVGQELEVNIDYISHAQTALDDLVIDVSYPSGFQYRSSSQDPFENDNRWRINRLSPGISRTLTIHGVLAGEEFEEKAFRANIGKIADGNTVSIFGGGAAATTLKKPFLDISVRIQGQQQAAASAGDTITVELPWKNNLPVGVKHVIIEADIEGEAIERSSLFVQNGAQRGETLVWDSSTFSRLSFLNPGETGRVLFTFNIKSLMPNKPDDKNFMLIIRSRIFSNETPDGFAGADISGRGEASLKMVSRAQLARRGFFHDSTLPNSGPLPMVVGQETTFTVVWSVTNAYNDMNNATVRAILPPYVAWKGMAQPESEKLELNSATRELVWNIGRLEAGTGFLRPARTASFAIGFTPTSNQAGSFPVLMQESVFTGQDAFVSVMLEDRKMPLTTLLLDDPKFTDKERAIIP